MKRRSVVAVLALALVAALVFFQVGVSDESSPPPEKQVRLGAGVKIGDINYLAGVGEISFSQGNTLYMSIGVTGYPRGDYPEIGMIWGLTVDAILFTDKFKFMEETIDVGFFGMGVSLFSISDPRLPPGTTVAFVNIAILAFQGKWEKDFEGYSFFVRGGPFINLGPGAIGIILEGGIWFS